MSITARDSEREATEQGRLTPVGNVPAGSESRATHPHGLSSSCFLHREREALFFSLATCRDICQSLVTVKVRPSLV